MKYQLFKRIEKYTKTYIYPHSKIHFVAFHIPDITKNTFIFDNESMLESKNKLHQLMYLGVIAFLTEGKSFIDKLQVSLPNEWWAILEFYNEKYELAEMELASFAKVSVRIGKDTQGKSIDFCCWIPYNTKNIQTYANKINDVAILRETENHRAQTDPSSFMEEIIKIDDQDWQIVPYPYRPF